VTHDAMNPGVEEISESMKGYMLRVPPYSGAGCIANFMAATCSLVPGTDLGSMVWNQVAYPGNTPKCVEGGERST
jgi:hypothetical protein